MKDKQKRKKERTWAEAARMVLENYSDAPMTPKQILQVIEAEGLKEMSGASPLACLNAMLHSNSRGADAVFYKLPGRISLFTLKDALQWSRSLSMSQIDELDDDGESCESTEASTVSGGDNDGSPDETSSNASCSTESHSQILPSTRACNGPVSQTSKQKKKTEVMLPRVVLTPLKVNGTQVESASAFTGRHANEMSSTSSTNYNALPVCSSNLRSSTPPPHLQSIRKTSGGQVKRNRGEEIDFETPGSILVNTNLRAVLNPRTFSFLPSHCQQQLLLLLPEVDRQMGNDGQLRLSSNALNNEFFTHAAQSWQERLADGEFTHEMQVRLRQEMEKEKKVEAWKGKFFEDYYGQRLGLTKEGMQRPSAEDDAENKFELSIEAEAVRPSHAPSGRLREEHFTKHSWPELGNRARRSLYNVAKSEESETLEEQMSFSLDNAQHNESKEEVHGSSCQKSAVNKFENSDTSNRSPYELERLAITPSSFGCECNISCISQETLKLKSKDQKRRCFEQMASSAFPEKKPRLEDRQSFRNTIKSVHTEKLQPTKEEPRVPPIRIQLSRIKPPWVVKGQPAFQICPRIISNHRSTRWGRTRSRTFASIKDDTQTGAAASTIGGGGGSGGGGSGSTNGRGGWQQLCNHTKTRASKRTCGICEPHFKRTQLLSSCCIDAEKTTLRIVIKPLKINCSVHENYYKLTLGQATSLVELRVETNTGAIFIVLFAISRFNTSREISGKENKVAKEVCDDAEAPSSDLVMSSNRYPSKSNIVFQEEEANYITVTVNNESTYIWYISGRSMINPVENIIIVSIMTKIPTFKSSHTFIGKYVSLVGSTDFATILGSMPDSKHGEPFNEVQFTEFDFTAVGYLNIKNPSANDDDDAKLTKILKKWPKYDYREKVVPANVEIRKRKAGGFQMESCSSHYVINAVGVWNVADTSKGCVLQFEDSPLEEGKCFSQQVLREKSRNGYFKTWGKANDTMDIPSEDLALDMCCESSKLKNPIINIVGINQLKPFIQIGKMKEDCPVCFTHLVSMQILENGEESLRWMINLFVPHRILNLNHTSTARQPKSTHSAKLCLSVDTRSPLFVHFLQGSLYLDNAQKSSRTRQEILPSSLCLAVDSLSVNNKSLDSGTRVKVPSWGIGRANKCKFGGIHLDIYSCLRSLSDSAQKSYYDIKKVFHGLEGLMNQSKVSGTNPHINSSLCSQEFLLYSFNFEDQEILSSSLAYIQQLSSDKEKGKSPANAEELTISGDVSLSITSSPNLSSETSIDKSYFMILEEKLIAMVYSGSTSSSEFNLEVSQSVLEIVSCPTKQVLPGNWLVCYKEGQPTQEELLLKQHLNYLNSRKGKIIPGCQVPVQINMVSRKGVVDETLELRENFQSIPLILNFSLFKLSKSTGKELQHPLAPLFSLKVNIKEILYRKFWNLHLHSTGYNYAADNPVEGFPRNFACGVKQLDQKANFTATNAFRSVQMFAKNSGVKQISMQSSCILKAMIMCKGCGALCHNNCVGLSKLCLCLVVR
ncbi:polycomb group protein ASXL1 isoform X2 [Microcaecilia unicolor]|uniref:Polycomb group protein ASXL1 isoform X2 n=1 Tax=Microcaecilia unicolor TaxID=1415580 RepID=A0A6P7YV45_9AMPH|nr:putative Polycomb group protein ASXL1 isoform X2 [Microcaecilia unicolor]